MRSPVMLKIKTTSFTERQIFQKLGQFLLPKSQIPLSCKTAFEDERTNHLSIQTRTPHFETETQWKITFYSGVRIHI
jgi:hypothetical protein